jgi:hypothetical protein
VTEPRSLTTLEVSGAADRALTSAGYRPIEDVGWEAWSNSARAYEDEYSVVAVFVFDSFENLDREWINAQTSLVELMTQHISRDEAKAWDGYLALLTPASADGPQQLRMNEIRRDTSRVRKLVATRDQINSLAGVERSLLPLLPLEPGLPLVLAGSALDVLPDLLAQTQIPVSIGRALVDAFDRQTSLMRALHQGDGR